MSWADLGLELECEFGDLEPQAETRAFEWHEDQLSKRRRRMADPVYRAHVNKQTREYVAERRATDPDFVARNRAWWKAYRAKLKAKPGYLEQRRAYAREWKRAKDLARRGVIQCTRCGEKVPYRHRTFCSSSCAREVRNARRRRSC